MDALAEKLDADIEKFMQDLADKKEKSSKGKPFNFDEWCKEIDQHPAFIRELKVGPDGQYSTEIQALQALIYDKESGGTDEVPSCSVKTDKIDFDVRHVWPLLILYPEHCQTDFIRECTDDSIFDDILAEVFEEPADWDQSEHKFRASNVRICIALNIKNEQNPIVREILPHINSLGEVLKWPGIVFSDGIPVLQIYTREWFADNMKLIDKKKLTFTKK